MRGTCEEEWKLAHQIKLGQLFAHVCQLGIDLSSALSPPDKVAARRGTRGEKAMCEEAASVSAPQSGRQADIPCALLPPRPFFVEGLGGFVECGLCISNQLPVGGCRRRNQPLACCLCAKPSIKSNTIATRDRLMVGQARCGHAVGSGFAELRADLIDSLPRPAILCARVKWACTLRRGRWGRPSCRGTISDCLRRTSACAARSTRARFPSSRHSTKKRSQSSSARRRLTRQRCASRSRKRCSEKCTAKQRGWQRRAPRTAHTCTAGLIRSYSACSVARSPIFLVRERSISVRSSRA